MRLFDTVLITASSQRQAAAFRALLARRLEHGLYPRELRFEVVADPPGGRIGTGGGTLWALHELLARTPDAEPAGFFETQRILLIHAGGESRRLPTYAPEGKLFAPLPLPSSALLPPVVLDLLLGLFLRYPWRRGEVVVSSGDVVLDFDTSAIPEDRGPVFGFAKPATPEQGARHGVFRFDQHREHVVDYLQKAPQERLVREALLEGTGDCALDIGLVSLGPTAVTAFLTLGEAPYERGSVRQALALGQVRFDLYLEVLTACLAGLSFESFWRRVGPASALPEDLARRVFEAFHPFGLGGTLTRSTVFIHVGALAELPVAARELLTHRLTPFYEPDGGELRPFEGEERVVHNSVDVELHGGSPGPILVEGCAGASLGLLAGANLVVGLEGGTLPCPLPRGICLDERRLDQGRVFVVLSASDSLKVETGPEHLVFCGQPLTTWLTERGLRLDEVLPAGAPADLFAARLFCLDAPLTFVAGYLTRPSAEWTRAFRAAERLSLNEIQDRDDPVRRDERRLALRQRQLRGLFRRELGWKDVSLGDFVATFAPEAQTWRAPLAEWLGRTDDALLRAYRARLFRGLAPESQAREAAVEFDYVRHVSEPSPLRVALKEDQIVWARAPLRFDLAGGWTDTPPYTLRCGGRVVNLAVDINGQPPIQVFCRRTAERHVRVHSIDLGHTETFTRFEQLLDYRDPVSPFALPKAALCLLGLDGLLAERTTLPEVLERLGAGIELTLLCAVPKGSGLGTSSILGAAILAALGRFFDRPVPQDELFRQVLQLEQMLTTGGGWQDQIGGVAGGVKYLESRPGLRPHPIVHQLDPFLFEDPASLARFTLFYTGITRLAKNILSEVVDQVNGASKAYLFTLRHMGQLALDAKDAIERRHLTDLASVIAHSWEANKRVHPSTTNDEVEALLAATRTQTLGVKLLGAGGGGYALFVSPDLRSTEALREILRARFEGRRARLVDFSLSRGGLAVSVS